MVTHTQDYIDAHFSPLREITAKIIYTKEDSSTIELTPQNYIKNFKIYTDTEDTKLFGICVVKKLQLEILDKDFTFYPNPKVGETLKVSLGIKYQKEISGQMQTVTEWQDYPTFYIKEVVRNEVDAGLTIAAYDALESLTEHTIAEYGAPQTPYTVLEFLEYIADYGGFTLSFPNITPAEEDCFTMSYPEGANFDMDEIEEEVEPEEEEEAEVVTRKVIVDTTNIKDVLKEIAELTQTICYIDYQDKLTFKRLKNTNDTYSIDATQYFDYKENGAAILQGIVFTTSGGESYANTSSEEGFSQYVTDNAFLDGLSGEDIVTWLNSSVTRIGNTSQTIFNLDWRGLPSLEVGDIISVLDRWDSNTFNSYYLNEVIEYDGGLRSNISFTYEDKATANESASPVTLGDAMKETFAKVDRINKEIKFQAAENESRYNETTGKIDEITNKAIFDMTPEAITLEISEAISGGVESVTNTAGTFNQDGLTIRKTDGQGQVIDGLETNLNNDGMLITASGDTVLTVNHEGVEAYNLRARNFLSIIDMCRFQPYNGKVGLFWVQGEE